MSAMSAGWGDSGKSDWWLEAGPHLPPALGLTLEAMGKCLCLLGRAEVSVC